MRSKLVRTGSSRRSRRPAAATQTQSSAAECVWILAVRGRIHRTLRNLPSLHLETATAAL
jgi:hypothetical protein